jgi:hypothetical protein
VAPPPSRSPSLTLSCKRVEDFPPHQAPAPAALFKGDEPRQPERLPSARHLDLAIETGNLAFTVTFALDCSAPLSPGADRTSCQEDRRPALPASGPVGLAALLASHGKMLLADFCNRLTNRALVDRSTPEPGGFHHPSVRARAARRLRRATLRRSGPPVEVCLTAHPELRPSRPPLHPKKEQARSHGLSDRGVFNRASGRRPTSDAPFRPPAAPWHSPAAAGALGSLLPRARQSARVSRPEASSLDRCPSRPAFAVPFRARHRSRGFATDEPASGAPSLPVALARGARPRAFRLSPEGIHGRAPPVDFCNRYDPRPQPRTRSNPAHRVRSRLRAQLVTSSRLSAQARSGGWPPVPQAGEANRDSTGQGRKTNLPRFPSRSLATRALPRPIWLGHLVS